MRVVGHEDHETEEAEEAGCGAADGAGGPLALGLEAEVRACFLDGDFDVPPLEVGGEDRQGVDLLIGAEERVGRERLASPRSGVPSAWSWPRCR
jgi:hypothetical protein